MSMLRRAFLKKFGVGMSAVAVAPFVPLTERASPFVPLVEKPVLPPRVGSQAFTLSPNDTVYGHGLFGKSDNLIQIAHFDDAKTLCDGDTLQVTYTCTFTDD